MDSFRLAGRCSGYSILHELCAQLKELFLTWFPAWLAFSKESATINQTQSRVPRL